jgi:membrane protein implicated in regulation of membrane protease activity
VIRTGALPKWLGYVMILPGVVALTPIGWAAAIGTAILVLVLSILLSARAYSRTSERIDRVTA